MIQSIKDFWPQLFGDHQSQDTESQGDEEKEEKVPEDNDKSIEETFKNMKWSRVIAVIDYDDNLQSSFDMKTDIMDSLQQME